MVKKGLGTEIYSGAAEFGRFRALLGVIFGTVIGIIMIGIGIYLAARRTKRTLSVFGNIKDGVPQCTVSSYSDKNGTTITYNCVFTVDYKIDDKPYSHTFTTNSSTNYVGIKDIRLYYESGKEGDVSLSEDNTHIAGWIVLGIGVFLIIGSWISWYIINRFKFAAAASGTAGAFEMIRGVIN
jgi:hypothetical protein